MLGEIRVWPRVGMVNSALTDYKIIPIENERFDISIGEPIEPMDWAGAIIEANGGQYAWTLYCGFTGSEGERRSYEFPSLLYFWPPEEIMGDDVEAFVERVYQAFNGPCVPLLRAIKEAESSNLHFD